MSNIRTSGRRPAQALIAVCTRVAVCLWLVLVASSPTAAQPAGNPQQGNFQNPAVMPGAGQGNVLFGAPGGVTGAGGGANADFETLIDLIESTVSVETWANTGGGDADIRPFFGGVLVDAAGTLSLRTYRAADELQSQRGAAPDIITHRPESDPRQTAELRYVSLPRLEREIIRRQEAGEPLDAAMLTLAGLQRVRYVFVYPESGDLVLAGPAGDWLVDMDGHIVSAETGEPVVRLDDLLVLLRRNGQDAGSFFGCSINPRQESLAATQTYLASTSQRPLQPGERRAWLAELRDTVGEQDIEIFGVDPASRVAGVLVAADYHMKLIGMGLADGVEGVESYLASIRVAPGQSPPPMSVLRWWFALHYEAIRASESGDAYELVGQGVRVLSENELLAERGQRVHTGDSEPLNRQFAERFTTHFAALAEKYPIYAELRNIFDLAMAVSLIQTDRLAEKAGWQPSRLADGEQLRLPQWPVPRQVETVINHRVVNRRHIVAGVSGGVMVAPGDVLARGVREQGPGIRDSLPAVPALAEPGVWWWDAE